MILFPLSAEFTLKQWSGHG